MLAGEEGEEKDESTLSALQRLSLQRKGRSSIHLDGNKSAKGIQGLLFGGRAGLAKKNLASLAPEGLPGTGARKNGWNGFQSLNVEELQSSSKGKKRVAGQGIKEGETEELGTEEMTARPSKLATLAAARGKSTAVMASSSQITPIEAKPLSKLQQKIQANLLARQQKKQPSSKQEEDLHKQREEEEEQNRLLHLPSGEPIATLFPVAPADEGSKPYATVSPDKSSFGTVLRASRKEDLTVPGGSPFDVLKYSEAFLRPSPDDIVLKAREGTNLAKT